MKFVGLAAFIAAAAFGVALAQETPPAPATGHVPADTVVRVELAETVSSAANFKGNTFAIRLAQPVLADGSVIVPAGTPGVGEIISSGHPGAGGQSGKLILVARYLDYKGTRIALHGLNLGARGADDDLRPVLKRMEYAMPGAKVVEAALPGKDVTIPSGATAYAKLTSDLDLPVVARATAAELAAPPATASSPAELDKRLAAPPTGKAQIVFFRPSLVSTMWASWRIWQDSAAVTDLGNGSYFVLTVDPGPHTFVTGLAGDSITLEPAAGDTDFVEQGFIQPSYAAEPVLYPSDGAAFQQLPKLKLAKASAPKR